jgi:transposase
VAVAHPGKLRLIFGSKRKNDRFDCEKLAKLLLLDMVPRVHVPNVDVRAWRSLIQLRQRLLATRVMAKNQIRAVLREHDLTDAAPRWLWSAKALAWLETLDLHASAMLRLELNVQELKSLKVKTDRVEKELACYADRHPAVALLMTIPGVGIRTAETFVAWVDDIARFRRTRQLGCYFGLVPCQDASANKNRLGHITRDGPPVMRKLITEAAWMAIRGCPAFKRYFEQVQAGKPERKKIALVATAHRLIRVMGARCSEAARRTTETMTAAITTRVLAKATAGAERTPRGPKRFSPLLHLTSLRLPLHPWQGPPLRRRGGAVFRWMLLQA